MYLVDYHTHPYGHGEARLKPPHNIKHLKKFINAARACGIKELGFSDHDWFLGEINWDNLMQIKNESCLKIRLGIEVDYKPEREIEIRKFLKQLPLDYCIGSVHAIGDWEVDHPDYIDEYYKRDIDLVYKQYFHIVHSCVLSGLFDIVGHLDLIKVFNFSPDNSNIVEEVEPILQSIKKQGMVIEINTNGLNKPAGEIYPRKAIIERAYSLEIPVTLGSDAHSSERVGENFKEIISVIRKIGYQRIATFSKRKMKLVNINKY